MSSPAPGPAGPPLVHHLAFADVWVGVRDDGEPYPWSTVEQTFDEVGFVHCALPHQVAGVVQRHYAGRTAGLVVLTVDPARSAAALVMEESHGGERFPHLYGPLTAEAVVAEEPLDAFLARQGTGQGGTEAPSP